MPSSIFYNRLILLEAENLISAKESLWPSLIKYKTICVSNRWYQFFTYASLYNGWAKSWNTSGNSFATRISDWWLTPPSVFSICAPVFWSSSFTAKYLNRPSKLLIYAPEAVYPFYTFHQTLQIFFHLYQRSKIVASGSSFRYCLSWYL